MDKYPAIRILTPKDEQSEVPQPSLQYQEPEVEDFCEDTQVKNIILQAGLDYEKIVCMRSLSHTPDEPSCVHCVLLDKVQDLKDNIKRIQEDIRDSEKTMKYKITSNKKVLDIIEKFEKSSHCRTASHSILETSSKSCSCTKSCKIF